MLKYENVFRRPLLNELFANLPKVRSMLQKIKQALDIKDEEPIITISFGEDYLKVKFGETGDEVMLSMPYLLFISSKVYTILNDRLFTSSVRSKLSTV